MIDRRHFLIGTGAMDAASQSTDAGNPGKIPGLHISGLRLHSVTKTGNPCVSPRVSLTWKRCKSACFRVSFGFRPRRRTRSKP
jgi:hypothetical protein